jgi:hypothetical protein
MERNYEKALQETEQILFLDPNNPRGCCSAMCWATRS